MALVDAHRVCDGVDVWVIPNFAQDVLHADPSGVLSALEQAYPTRCGSDAIRSHDVQWVAGNHQALKYRGRAIKRTKMWLQRENPNTRFLRYGYTGWQWSIAGATADVAECPEVAPLADRYDAFARAQGKPDANHFIVTRYKDGSDGIGWHFDKAADIVEGSLITVVKLGHSGRRFQLRWLAEKGAKENMPFFSRLLEPGTAVVMTLEANLATQHCVPEDAGAGASASIVFRSVKTALSPSCVAQRTKASEANKARAAERKRKRE